MALFMSTFDRVVEAGKSFACSLYRTQPGALIPNPINDVLRVVWDDLCGDDPNGLPPPPSTPFSGGQCRCVEYTVYAEIYAPNEDRWLGLNPTRWWGEIGGIKIDRYPGGTEDIVMLYCRGAVSRNPTCSSEPFWDFYFPAGVGLYTQARITSVVRVGGGVDNCGDPPAVYPPAVPPPPNGYTSPPTSITYNDGDDFTAIFNLKPPTNDTPPPPDICLSVIVSGVEVKLCFPFGLPPSLSLIHI